MPNSFLLKIRGIFSLISCPAVGASVSLYFFLKFVPRMGYICIVLLWFPALLGASPAFIPKPEKDISATVFDPTQQVELILQLNLKRYLLIDTFIGYLEGGSLILPLGEIMNALEFPIIVDPSEGKAEGWFLREHRRFSLNVSQHEAIVEGKKTKFPTKKVFLRDGEIYVESGLLASWFPFNFNFNIADLQVTIITEEKFPFEERLEREERFAKMEGRRKGKDQLPRKEIPYSLFSWPALNSSYNFAYDNTSNDYGANYSNLVSGDFFFMNTEIATSGNREDQLSSLRIKMGRQDPDNELFWFLKASEFSMGDIFTPQIPLAASSKSGVGFQISSFPLLREAEFDRINLRGDLQAGWEVELYRNEILLDAQTEPDADGRYEFLDTPLLYGSNIIRLVFYGPQGQRREEVQTLNVGSDQAPPGEQYFRFATVFQDTKVYDASNTTTTTQRGDGQQRYIFEYQRGVARWLSVAGSFASLPLQTDRRYFGTLGLRSGLLGASTRLDITKNDIGGTALEAATLTNVYGLNIFLEHTRFFDFESERENSSTADPVLYRNEIRLDSSIPSWKFFPRIPWSLKGDLERKESGLDKIDLANRLSIFLFNVSASNTVNWAFTQGGDTKSTSTGSGAAQLSGRIKAVSLRGSLDYTLKPEAELTTASLTSDFKLGQDFSGSLGVTKQLNGDGLTAYTAGLNKRFKSFAVGINGTYNNEAAYSLGSSITFSLGREPRTGSWVQSSGQMASGGSASVLVFLDNNNNQVFDKGDDPLPDVKFRSGGRGQKTNAEGIAFLTGLSSNRPTPIVLDISSLEDPFWLPAKKGYEVVSRPGRTALLEFPITPTGEIDGTVYLVSGESEKAVSNTKLQLVNSQGEVVLETKSEYDGFYLLQMVPPGQYQLRVDPEQIERLKLQTPESQTVIIEGSESILSGMDFLLKRKDL